MWKGEVEGKGEGKRRWGKEGVGNEERRWGKKEVWRGGGKNRGDGSA